MEPDAPPATTPPKRVYWSFPDNYDDLTPEEQDEAVGEMATELQRQLGQSRR